MDFQYKADLGDFGWDKFWMDSMNLLKAEQLLPARVTKQDKDMYRVFCAHGDCAAKISGRFRFDTMIHADFPAVGDWVLMEMAEHGEFGVIQSILPRRNRLSRKTAGAKVEEQVLAANIDTAFLVCGLGSYRSFNLRRLERYMALAAKDGLLCVIVLNKADLCADLEEQMEWAQTLPGALAVIATSAVDGRGLDALRSFLAPKQTAIFLGSSGAGKSTLINLLAGESLQDTGGVRQNDGKGKHTTTARHLFRLPNGALVLDTPGMRELQLWEDGESLDVSFSDVEALAGKCRFRDCGHNGEPDCAIREALENKELEDGRFANYLKMKREARFLEDKDAYNREKEAWGKRISKFQKKLRKDKNR